MKQCSYENKPVGRLAGCGRLFLLLLCVSFSFSALARTYDLKGVVRSESGEPVLGATVVVEGTPRGVTTDVNGAFTIAVNSGETLLVQFIGYVPQKFRIGNQTTLDVTLKEAANQLEEVVVVGYGTQKKRDVVGAVEQVSGKIFEQRANPSPVRSLQGQVAGLNITMNDGKASRGADIKIRGAVSSIGAGGSALVLVDGVEGDLTAVNPDDIKSISVLKDASSTAVYGARGAFGVVLVTTKDPVKGKVHINYNGSFSILNRTVEPETETNGLRWFNSYMESYVGYFGKEPSSINNIFPYNAAWAAELARRDADPSFEKWRVNSDGEYEYFGNTDWHKVVYRDYTTGHQHNLSVSGGTDVANYYLSGRFFEQKDIYNAGDGKFKQYNVRAKGSLKLFKWMRIENSTDFVRRTNRQPRVSATFENRLLTINRMLEHQGYPVTLVKNPDGTWTNTAAYIGWAGFVEGDTYQDNFKFDMKNTTALTVDIIKDVLTFKGDFTYLYNHSEQDRVNNQHSYSNGPGMTGIREEYSDYENRTYNTNYYATNATLTYSPRLGDDHSLSMLAGWNVEEKQYMKTLAYRTGLLDSSKPNFSLMDGTDITLKDNGSYEWGFAGAFFRVNYGYKGKYLVEVSGRYDGSSKFPSNQVWGFFPSASAGWRISEEGFMEGARTWLDNLKLRFSVGSAGNGAVDPYKYLSIMSISKSSVLMDGQYFSYTAAPGMQPKSLTWETATTYDLGLDLDMFNGRFNFTADIYRRVTTDMFTPGKEIPAVAGYTAPRGNYASMRTDGWELSVGWRDSFKAGGKDFNYNLKVSVWDNLSKITKYTSKKGLLPTLYDNNYYEGMTIGEIWGYHVLGLFATDAEAADWGPRQTATFTNNNNEIYQAGDLKFADLDDSGAVNNGDGTIYNHGDLRKIGNTTPRYCYGINVGFNWNGIGLSMFWQGVGQRDWFPAKESSYFWGQYGRSYGFALPWQDESHRWTEENQNSKAYWPRMRGYIAEKAKGIMSSSNDRYIQDASYIRLKNLTVDYTFPKKISRKIGMESLKVYFSGDNLLTFSPLKKYAKNFDPEVIGSGDQDFSSSAGKEGDGYGYPMMRSFTLGINLTF